MPKKRTLRKYLCILKNVRQSLIYRLICCGGSHDRNITCIQQCLHWVYSNKLDLRAECRIQLCVGLIQQRGNRGRMTDSGHSRDHVAPLLEVLACIVDGICNSLQYVHVDLLVKILLPLHKPNEMIESR